MRRTLDRLFDGAAALAAVTVAAILVLMIAASLGRLFEWRVGWVNDVVSWLCAAAAFMGMAHAFKNGDFVRVTLLLDWLSPPIKRRLEIAALALATWSIGYLAWWAARYTLESYQFNDIANNMVAIPMWIPQVSFVIGALLFLLAVVDELVIVLRGGKPTYERLMEERHARGDFSEDL